MKFIESITLVAIVGCVSATSLGGPLAAAGASSGENQLKTCVNHYNELVLEAKKSLSGGDRNRAISLLLEAHSQLGHCQEIREQSPAASVRLGSNPRNLSTAGPA